MTTGIGTGVGVGVRVAGGAGTAVSGGGSGSTGPGVGVTIFATVCSVDRHEGRTRTNAASAVTARIGSRLRRSFT